MSTTGSNSKYAWRELASQDLPKRSAPERIFDFLEIYGLYDEETARQQATRCIQCPEPSCVDGCPMCNPIPQWMLLTAEGRFLEAAAVLGSASNMADICARLCPSDHLCEKTCLLGGVSDAVPIRAIEQFLTDYASAHQHTDATKVPPNGLRVAVVGSGPAGLACADELAKRGYAVTIFDSDLVPGGLLVNGTPAFKLERSVVQRRIEVLRKRGVVFRLGMQLCQDLTLEQLKTGFDATFLGFDSRQSRPLKIPGADLKGVVPAVPFLLHKVTPIPLEIPQFDLAGKRVVVIGAGDSAMDCLRTAIRWGARETICLYRRDEADMPCSKHEYENAKEEGARFLFRTAPVEVLGDAAGQVAGLRVVRTEFGPAEPGGRRPFTVQPGTESIIEADWVVPALGFDPLPCPHSSDFSQLKVNEWGGLVVDENLMTSIPGIFAGGDIVRGPSLVLHAVRDARKAASSVDAFLAPRIKATR